MSTHDEPRDTEQDRRDDQGENADSTPPEVLDNLSEKPFDALATASIAHAECQESTDRPTYHLYSPGSVAWAAFGGGILGAAIVLARNEWMLQRRWRAAAILAVMLVLTLALGYAVGLTGFMSLSGFALLNCFAMWFVASLLQGPTFDAHRRAGGPAGSGAIAFCLGLLGSVGTLVLLVGIHGAMQASLGARVRIGRNDEVYFRGGATANDARKLGEYLRACDFFDDVNPQSAMLEKDGETVLISFVYDEGEWNDPELIREMENFAMQISAELFEEHPVEMLLLNSMSVVKRRCTPKIGVSTKDWDRHFDAADEAFSKDRFVEAEAEYRAAAREAERHESLRPQLILSLNNIGNCRLVQGFTDDVEPHFQRALATAETTFGPNSFEASFALYGLGRWEWKRGNPSEAEAFFRRALAMREKVDDERLPDPSEILESLVSLLMARESYTSAREFQQRQIVLLERSSAGRTVHYGDQLRLMAWLNWRTGNYQEAKNQFAQALEVFASASDSESGEFLTCLWQSGMVSHAMGDFAAADERLRRAIKVLEETQSAKGMVLAEFREALADLLVDEAQYEEAEQLLRQVLLQHQRELKPGDVAIGVTQSRLGSLAFQLGRLEEAETRLGQAIEILEKSDDAPRLRLADCLQHFAELRQQQGRYQDAEPYCRKSLAIREEVLGAEHDSVAMAIAALSDLHAQLGNYSSAEALARRAHELAEKRLGPEHPLLIQTLHSLAVVQLKQGDLDAAEKTIRRELDIGGKKLGAQHPTLAEVQCDLAVVLLYQKRSADAQPFLEQGLKSLEAVVGTVHPLLIGPLNNLACVYREQGRNADAAERLERALKIAEKVVGKTHVSLLPILANYASVLRKLERIPEAQELERRADEIRATLNPELQRPESSYVI